MKREGVGCRAFAVDEGEIRERNSLLGRGANSRIIFQGRMVDV